MTTNSSQQGSHHPDFDLDEMIPVNFLDDMDLCGGFNINDQDFTSMKSIVEQTFKDGRDVMDIISAVWPVYIYSAVGQFLNGVFDFLLLGLLI